MERKPPHKCKRLKVIFYNACGCVVSRNVLSAAPKNIWSAEHWYGGHHTCPYGLRPSVTIILYCLPCKYRQTLAFLCSLNFCMRRLPWCLVEAIFTPVIFTTLLATSSHDRIMTVEWPKEQINYFWVIVIYVEVRFMMLGMNMIIIYACIVYIEWSLFCPVIPSDPLPPQFRITQPFSN